MTSLLPHHDIHLWSLPFAENIHTNFTDGDIDVLFSQGERVRYDKFKVNGKRDEFIVSRLLLRHLLKLHTEYAGHDIEAVPDEMGRPFWQRNKEKIPFYFSLSHTKGMVCCAVSMISEIGCDVERMQQRKYEKDLAKRIFTASEKNYYDSLHGESQSNFFYKSWTLKESYVKAIGQGLRIPLTSLPFTTEINLNRLTTIPNPQQGKPDSVGEIWSFLALSPESHYVLSCATRIPQPQISVFHAKLVGRKIEPIRIHHFKP